MGLFSESQHALLCMANWDCPNLHALHMSKLGFLRSLLKVSLQGPGAFSMHVFLIVFMLFQEPPLWEHKNELPGLRGVRKTEHAWSAGDTHISLAQRLFVTGAVIVTTPQEVALSDVRRSLNMFKMVHIPLLGILENMSYHACPGCGRKSEVFGAGGGALLAAAQGVPLLACLPLDERVMHGGEDGAPVVLTHPNSEVSVAFRGAADALCKQLSLQGSN
jgi:hypothetical protein